MKGQCLLTDVLHQHLEELHCSAQGIALQHGTAQGFRVTATCNFLHDDNQQKPLSFDNGKKGEVLAALSWL